MEVRKNFKNALVEKGIIVPFLFDGFQAAMVKHQGYQAGYLTGFGAAASMGMPDVGLVTQTEMINKVISITSTVDLPIIADADTGYGNYINIIRTVREYERAGVAGLHLEDQEFPKRCGYMANKQVIDKYEAAAKIKAALDARKDADMLIIARSDALAVNGWDDTEDRLNLYLETGADMIFVDGIRTIEDVREYQKRFPEALKLLNNVPRIHMKDIEQAGSFNLILHPGPMGLAWQAYDNQLIRLREVGAVDCDTPFSSFTRAVTLLGAQTQFDLGKHYSDVAEAMRNKK